MTVYSVRFPRLVRRREDKDPEDATTADQILDMFNGQDVIKNNLDSDAEEEDEDNENYL